MQETYWCIPVQSSLIIIINTGLIGKDTVRPELALECRALISLLQGAK